MAYSCYKKLIPCIICALVLQIMYPLSIYAEKVLWPSEMNLDNDIFNLDDIVPKTTTASNSKKGFLLVGDPKEIFTLGAGHIGINVTLSGKGHVMIQYLKGLKERGVKITLILVNDKAPVGADASKAPADMKNPYFYMIDFSANNGVWQKYNFERILEDYSPYVDDWVIGNEINSQLYNFYGPAKVKDYTKKYCENFEICYKAIKEKNPNADVYISFDQGWDLPAYNQRDRRCDKKASLYRYNAKEVLSYINEYLDKSIDWGVSLHPYPAPVGEGAFWDDKYAGFDVNSPIEGEEIYLITLKNFEIALQYLSEKKFLRKDKSVRNIAITEFAVTSLDGERIQAAGLYYLWEKVRDNPLIKYFLYNAQIDLPDNYKFGLTSIDAGRKRLAWAVFKDMDNNEENGWCKDLLCNVLDDNNQIDVNGILINRASLSEFKAYYPALKDYK